MNTIKLDGSLYYKMLLLGAEKLNENRTIVNDLNVFPIPDGDTGDNMYMTISSGCLAVENDSESSLNEIASKGAKGMLLGARGNSGVILSRIFAGIAKGLKDVTEADAKTLGNAFKLGIEEAYQAVQNPVEGTILTVYKDAVNFANKNIEENHTLENYFNDFLLELRNSLDRTPELLDVLKEAGVVDSGGAGIVYIMEGMQSALNGGTVKDIQTSPGKKQSISLLDEKSYEDLGYCTEFILQLFHSKTDSEFNIDTFNKELELLGDSIVSFREDDIVKVHIHVKVPGIVLNFAQKYGEFLSLKIENMTLQHSESIVQNNYSFRKTLEHKKYGIITVASGKGIVNTFRELGVDIVIEGGQSMNPSTNDFIDAFKKINADTILIFPNNSNIILTAEQAAKIYKDTDVRIVQTKTIGEGYAAISMLDTTVENPDNLIIECNEIIKDVVSAMVSKASRDSSNNGLSIKENDYLGFTDDDILSCNKDKEETIYSLCEKLNYKNYDVCLLIQGENSSDEEAQKIKSTLENKYRRTEIIIIKGEQPIYDYILVLE